MREAATGPLGNELFEKEQDDLLMDLKNIPKKACDRRVSPQSYLVFILLVYSTQTILGTRIEKHFLLWTDQ